MCISDGTMTFMSGDASIVIAITYLFYLLKAGTSFFNDKWFNDKVKDQLTLVLFVVCYYY